MIKEADLAKLRDFYLKNQKEPFLIDIVGTSMQPILKDGFKAKVVPVHAKSVNYGDIVLFLRKKIICHRVIGKFNWRGKIYLIQSGDSAKIGGIIEEKELIGKVIEAYDSEGKNIDGVAWKECISPLGVRVFSAIYFIFFLTKRALFGKKQNRFTRAMKGAFWKISRCALR